jgi:hypothetical protein
MNPGWHALGVAQQRDAAAAGQAGPCGVRDYLNAVRRRWPKTTMSCIDTSASSGSYVHRRAWNRHDQFSPETGRSHGAVLRHDEAGVD